VSEFDKNQGSKCQEEIGMRFVGAEFSPHPTEVWRGHQKALFLKVIFIEVTMCYKRRNVEKIM